MTKHEQHNEINVRKSVHGRTEAEHERGEGPEAATRDCGDQNAFKQLDTGMKGTAINWKSRSDQIKGVQRDAQAKVMLIETSNGYACWTFFTKDK